MTAGLAVVAWQVPATPVGTGALWVGGEQGAQRSELPLRVGFWLSEEELYTCI